MAQTFATSYNSWFSNITDTEKQVKQRLEEAVKLLLQAENKRVPQAMRVYDLTKDKARERTIHICL